MTDGPSAEDLIRRFRSGDFRAFGRLVRNYKAAVYTYLIAETDDEAAAGSLLHDAFLRVVERLEDYDGTPPFEVYLYRLAHHARRRHAAAPKMREAGEIERFIKVLKPDERTALLLREGTEFDLDQIAEVMQCPKRSVEDAMNRALVSVARAAACGVLAGTEDDDAEDPELAAIALGWRSEAERTQIAADPPAQLRLAMMERARTRMRALLTPREPPDDAIAKLKTAALRRLRSRSTRRKRVATPIRWRPLVAATGVIALLAAGGYALATTQGGEAPEEPEQRAAAELTDVADPPAVPAEPPPPDDSVVLYEANGGGPDPAPAQDDAKPNSRAAKSSLEKAARLARRHRCKKAARLFVQALRESEDNIDAVVAGTRPCTDWLQRHHGDDNIEWLNIAVLRHRFGM